jgi:hypothetical protein
MAVLQGWSRSTIPGRLIGGSFLIAMGVAAMWGVRTLMGPH